MIFRAEARAWLGRAVGSACDPLDIVPMGGATSSSLFRIEVARGDIPKRFVLRVLDNREWLAAEPDLASHEAAALGEARRAGLPAPRLVAHADDDVGFGAPVVLMSFLDGSVDLRPADFQGWLRWLAGQLAAIHQHPVDWINACRGPAGVDVAHCRTNLAQMYGPVAADRFLDAYLSTTRLP